MLQKNSSTPSYPISDGADQQPGLQAGNAPADGFRFYGGAHTQGAGEHPSCEVAASEVAEKDRTGERVSWRTVRGTESGVIECRHPRGWLVRMDNGKYIVI